MPPNENWFPCTVMLRGQSDPVCPWLRSIVAVHKHKRNRTVDQLEKNITITMWLYFFIAPIQDKTQSSVPPNKLVRPGHSHAASSVHQTAEKKGYFFFLSVFYYWSMTNLNDCFSVFPDMNDSVVTQKRIPRVSRPHDEGSSDPWCSYWCTYFICVLEMDTWAGQ